MNPLDGVERGHVEALMESGQAGARVAESPTPTVDLVTLAAETLFAGPGEMRARCRAYDWGATALGPVAGWPQSLRTAVDVCLGSAFASSVWWGPELVQLYNDAAIAINGAKHPAGLGRSARDAWAEVWPAVGPLAERVLATGEPFFGEDVAVVPDRGGPREPAYFTFCYSALRDDAGDVAGVLGVSIETTEAVRARAASASAGAALRASEARQAYLLTLSDALRPLDDPVAIQGEAARLIGERLDVDRVLYAETQGDTIVVHRDWARGVASMAGRFDAALWGEYMEVYLRGEAYVVHDVACDSKVDATAEASYRSVDIAAFIGIGLIKGGAHVASFGVHSRTPRTWTAEEVALVRETAERIWAATERAHAEIALRESEEKYRTIFDSIDEGFATHEMLYDAEGRPTDLRYLQTNRAYEQHSGLADCVGRTVRDMSPNVEAEWVESYARVAHTGEPMRFERFNADTDRWYNVYLSRVGDGRRPLLATVVTEITERKRNEAALAAAAARDAFLVRLADALRPLADALAVQEVAARLLGEHLGANQVLYGETTGETVVIHEGYGNGVPPVVGTFHYTREGWGGALLESYRAGRTAVCRDVQADPTITPGEAAVLSDAMVGAYVAVPLLKDSQWVAALCVNQMTPRDWRPEEIALVEDVAERTWAAVERARSQAALLESGARLAALFEIIPVGVGIVDPTTGKLILSNPEMRRYLPTNVMPSHDDVRGSRWRAWHEDGRTVAPHDYPGSRSLRGESTLPGLDMLYTQEDGQEVWTRVRGVPIRDGQGRITGAAVTVTDVDSLVRSADILRASEERYRLIVDGAHEYAILTTDAHGCIDSWSHGAESAFGWSAADAVGQPLDLVFVPEDRTAGVPARELATARERGVAPDIRWHQRKDGTRVFIDGAMRALRRPDGSLRGFLKLGQDVTARRALDEALRASETRYRTLIDNVLDYGIFGLDSEGVVIAWTPGAERVKGYLGEEVVGRHFALFYTPEDIAADVPMRELAQAAATGRAEGEGWRVRKGGVRFWGNEIATAVRDRDGRLIGFTKIVRDLTERRAAEQAAEQVRAAGERDALRRQLGQAEEEERRRLSRELHDEAGQHLTALSLGLQSLSDDVPADSDVDRRARQLRDLANVLGRDLHAIAVRLRPKALDDFGLEAALAANAEEWSRQTGIRIAVHARGDRDRLPSAVESAIYRVVQEALTNVARHSGATDASLQVERRDGQVVAVVEDNGTGFDPEAVSHALDGVRLGLRGIRERVALLGGTLAIESTVGAGTSLFICIPTDMIEATDHHD